MRYKSGAIKLIAKLSVFIYLLRCILQLFKPFNRPDHDVLAGKRTRTWSQNNCSVFIDIDFDEIYKSGGYINDRFTIVSLHTGRVARIGTPERTILVKHGDNGVHEQVAGGDQSGKLRRITGCTHSVRFNSFVQLNPTHLPEIVLAEPNRHACRRQKIRVRGALFSSIKVLVDLRLSLPPPGRRVLGHDSSRSRNLDHNDLAAFETRLQRGV